MGFTELTTQHPPPAKVDINSATSGGRAVGIVRLRTKTPRVSFVYENYTQTLYNSDKDIKSS
jgi:hypothetical protein